MSKKTVNTTGQKRQAKAQRRKTLVRGHARKQGTVEERVIKRVKHQVRTNARIDVEQLTISEVMEQCRDRIAGLLPFHYYLIFIQEMIEGNVLQSFKLNYDVTRVSKIIRNLNISINNIPLLDEDISQMETARIAEDIQGIALEIHDQILTTSSIEKWVEAMIMRRGEVLPPKANGLPRSNQEIFNEVLRITGINYMASKVFNVQQQSAVNDAPVQETPEEVAE